MFENEELQRAKRHYDYEVWQLRQTLDSVQSALRNKADSEEGYGYEDIEEVVREHVEPLEERMDRLEEMVKELLKAHVPTLTEAKP